MDDCKILGLTENYSEKELKKAYQLKAKQFHPDKNENRLNNHLAMIRLNQAYSNLQRSITKPIVNENYQEDIAYGNYKKGIELFQAIHPSKWKKNPKKNLFSPDAIETENNAVEIIEELLESMSRAYFYFSLVVNDSSNSC